MKTVVTLASIALLVSCASKEDQLVDARRQQRQVLDALYAEYGGGALAAEVKKEADRSATEIDSKNAEQRDAARELVKMFGNAAGEVDRAAFEAQCLTLGEGARPVIMNDKAKVFFAVPATEKECIKAAQLARKIATLEEALGAPRPR